MTRGSERWKERPLSRCDAEHGERGHATRRTEARTIPSADAGRFTCHASQSWWSHQVKVAKVDTTRHMALERILHPRRASWKLRGHAQATPRSSWKASQAQPTLCGLTPASRQSSSHLDPYLHPVRLRTLPSAAFRGLMTGLFFDILFQSKKNLVRHRFSHAY